MCNYLDFIDSATNVYRTKFFIVKQVMGIEHDDVENNVVFSHDTYYKRTRLRNKQYEVYFKNRKNIDGKRLPSTMYSRNYVK